MTRLAPAPRVVTSWTPQRKKKITTHVQVDNGIITFDNEDERLAGHNGLRRCSERLVVLLVEDAERDVIE